MERYIQVGQSGKDSQRVSTKNSGSDGHLFVVHRELTNVLCVRDLGAFFDGDGVSANCAVTRFNPKPASSTAARDAVDQKYMLRDRFEQTL